MDDKTKTNENTTLTLDFLLPGFDGLPEHMKPVTAMMTRMQAEWIKLCCRRAEAYLELPQKMLACRDLGEVARLQTEFLVAMNDHYSQCTSCMMAADALAEDKAIRPAEDAADAAPDAKAKGEHEQRRAA